MLARMYLHGLQETSSMPCGFSAHFSVNRPRLTSHLVIHIGWRAVAVNQ
jgi:hypothetical protein